MALTEMNNIRDKAPSIPEQMPCIVCKKWNKQLIAGSTNGAEVICLDNPVTAIPFTLHTL